MRLLSAFTCGGTCGIKTCGELPPFETESVKVLEFGVGGAAGDDDDDRGLLEVGGGVFWSQKTFEAPSAFGSLGRRDEQRMRTVAVGTR